MSYTLLSMKSRSSRKKRCCVWCGEGIPVGEKHLAEASIWEGEMQSHRWHPECRQAAEDGWTAGDEAEFTPGENERPTTGATHA